MDINEIAFAIAVGTVVLLFYLVYSLITKNSETKPEEKLNGKF